MGAKVVGAWVGIVVVGADVGASEAMHWYMLPAIGVNPVRHVHEYDVELSQCGTHRVDVALHTFSSCLVHGCTVGYLVGTAVGDTVGRAVGDVVGDAEVGVSVGEDVVVKQTPDAL